MTRRTTLVLDEAAQQQLEELTAVYGSQTAAVRQAIADAYAVVQRRQKREAFIDWLIAESGEPSEEDREWARQISIKIAAARESQRP